MWSIALIDLQLTEQQFWSCTPREFDSLIERWILSQEREDRRFALICSILANINRSKKSKQYGINDFIIHDYRGKSLDNKQSWQQQLNFIETMHNRFFGKKKQG